jgi:hypothetical protein
MDKEIKKEFLPKEAEKALFVVKEKLYDRLRVLRTCLEGSQQDEHGYIDPFDMQMNNEVQFLEDLLDMIERG